MPKHRAPTMTNKPTRLSRARQIRDSAVEVLKQRGVWEPAEIGDGKTVNVLQVQTDDLHVVLRTPFQQLPDVAKSEHMKYLGALKNIARTYLLPYGLDIWSSEKKVMTLSWDDTGSCELDNFRVKRTSYCPS